MKATLVPLRVLRRASLLLVCSLLALAAVPQALAQESPPEAEPPPAESVPADSTPAPDPDPAPVEQPPKEQPAQGGGQTSQPPAPAPTYSPPVSTYTPPPAATGPTPEELAQRERERKEARRERERKEAERLRKQREKSVKGGFAAFLDAATHAPPIEVPVVTPEAEPETQAPEPIVVEAASQEVAAPFSEPTPGASSLAGAGPVLLGLLGLAVLLLGVAALPPWSVRSPALVGLLVHRRLEIGLVGTAVLASAAIGLAIAVAAG